MAQAYLFYAPLWRILDDNGDPIPGAKINFWLTGTTTPTDTYTDSGLTTPHANPVVADAAGKFEPIYLDPSITYRAYITDADDALIDDVDPMAPPRSDPSGTIVMFHGTAVARDAAYPTADWQVCDGTLGSPDLRDKFVMGAGATYLSGDTGGSASVTSGSSGAHDHGAATGGYTLTLADIPSHHHGIKVDNTAGTTYAVSAQNVATDSFAGWSPSKVLSFNDNFGSGQQAIEDVGGGGSHSHSISSDGAHTHSVATVPPFVAIWFLYKK